MKLRVHRLNENAKLPNYAHEDDSGMDVYAAESVLLPNIRQGRAVFKKLMDIVFSLVSTVTDMLTGAKTFNTKETIVARWNNFLDDLEGGVNSVSLSADDLSSPVRAVSTGISVEIPDGYELQVRSRSGLAKKGIIVANSPGTIDEGYRGELKVLLMNVGSNHYCVVKGDKIAQLVLAPVTKAQVVDMTSDDQRGSDGFGSTDAKLKDLRMYDKQSTYGKVDEVSVYDSGDSSGSPSQ